MPLLEAPLISTLLALAATFLCLSILVQIVQELYKFLTSSKSSAYTIALKDFLGPWAGQLLGAGAFPYLSVRGPFQLARVRPQGKVLPMKKEDLVSALERTAPPWIQRVLNQLNLEISMQSGKASAPSAAWKKLLEQIGAAEKGTSGFLTATEIAGFLKIWAHGWDPAALDNGKATRRRRARSRNQNAAPVMVGLLTAPSRMDAARIGKDFRRQFLSNVDTAAERFPLLEQNFTYAYSRRNMRHSFVIALLLALACNLPFDQLYLKASGLTVEQASALAGQVLALKANVDSASLPADDTAKIRQLLTAVSLTYAPKDSVAITLGSVNYIVDLHYLGRLWQQDWKAIPRYLLGCFMTALLVSFGAPIWNDIASSLLRLQKGVGKQKGGG